MSKGLLPVCAILFPLALRSQETLTLSSEGKSRYCIVVATNAAPADQYAAQELQRYVEKLSGAQSPTVCRSHLVKFCSVTTLMCVDWD